MEPGNILLSEMTDHCGRRWQWSSDDPSRYVYLRPDLIDSVVAYTEELGVGVLIDRTVDGTVVGIEFL